MGRSTTELHRLSPMMGFAPTASPLTRSTRLSYGGGLLTRPADRNRTCDHRLSQFYQTFSHLSKGFCLARSSGLEYS